MAVFRITAEWSGFTGAPGYSVFHFSAIEASTAQAQAAGDAVRTFFDGIKALLPSVVNIRVRSTVEVLNEATGLMENEISIAGPASVPGGTGASYTGASGAVIHWTTNDVRNGRRVRGRTFVVPLAANQYDGQGSLTTTAVDTLNTAAAGLRATTPALQVWARPTAKGAADGAAFLVTGSRVPDMAAVLRSRRD